MNHEFAVPNFSAVPTPREGCEYHILAGRDATRLLAKNKLEETRGGWIFMVVKPYEAIHYIHRVA